MSISAAHDLPHPARRAALWLLVPGVTALLGIAGWGYAARLRAAGGGDEPQLLLAVLAAAACLAVAGWWLGGLLMLAVASTARRLSWRGLEHWATRLTPAVVARTAAAVVGMQLVLVAPAHADDAAVDPFWSPAATGTQQFAGDDGHGGTENPGSPSTPDSAAGGTSTETVQGAEDGSPAVASPGTSPTAPSPSSSPGDQQATPESPLPPVTPAPLRGAALPAQDGVPAATGHAGSRLNPPAPQRAVDGVLTVMAGDTLWDLTADLLGPGASDAEVSQRLPDWLEHNALEHHGDLIHPGDQLRIPPDMTPSQETVG